MAVIRYYLCIEEENRLLAAVECSEISDNELQLKAEALAVDAASGLQLEKVHIKKNSRCTLYLVPCTLCFEVEVYVLNTYMTSNAHVIKVRISIYLK